MITGLSADLLPHRQWAVSKWFYANRLWYYHRPGTDEEIIASPRFYQLVDPELRDLCHLLNEAGLRTMPSCQGHSYPRERFENIWRELERELPQITGEGLIVRDCETDREFLFRDPGYRLPWEEFEDFYHAAGEHQGVGYIGILVPSERAELGKMISAVGENEDLEIREDKRVGRLFGGRLFHVMVRSPDPLVRAIRWRGITEYFESLLMSSAHQK